MKIYTQIKKHLRENNQKSYENITFPLFCYQNHLNINTLSLALDL